MSPTSRLSWQCMRSAFRSHPPSTSLTNHSRALRQSSYPSVSRGIYTASRSFKAEPAVAKPPPPTTTKSTTTSSSPAPAPADQPIKLQEEDSTHVDWATSFHGLSVEPFSKEAADVLLAPLDEGDIEIKPDGIIYLPEIKYRRILNKAFGPGGWGLAPRSETIVTDKSVTREYALLAHGRLVSIARGEQVYFNKDGVPTASEGCKSNAMMRCCKDLGVASELWDPRFIRKWKSTHAREAFVEHQGTKKRTKIWLRKGDPVSYPFVENKK